MKKLISLLFVTLLLAACGTVPVPVARSDSGPAITRISDSDGAELIPGKDPDSDSAGSQGTASIETITQDDGVPSDQKATGDAGSTVAPVTMADSSDSGSIVKRPVKEHITRAIKFLQNGKSGEARQELESAVRQDPGNAIATKLMVQIISKPEEFFHQKNSFSYRVGRGESLSMISKRFLNDSLQFYILAKYNGLDNPGKLEAGQTIRIPGTRSASTTSAKKSRKKTKRKTASGETGLKLALAKKLYDSGKYQETIDLLESVENIGKYAGKRRDLLVLTYALYANVLTEKAELLEAEAILEKAVSMEPGNKKLKKQLKGIRNRRKASEFYNEGLQAMNVENHDKAYSAFSKVLELDPKHELARRKVTEIKSEVIESLHKLAMQSYRKQELNKAIELWDKVLVMDTDHELAKLYRARAVGLKKRFDKL